MFLPWKQICVECILKKSYNFRFTAQELLSFTMCTYICAGNKKAQNSTSFPTLKQCAGLSGNSDAFAVQLDVFFTLSFPGAASKTGVSLSFFGPSCSYLLAGQYKLGRNSEGGNIQHKVDFITETVKIAEKSIRMIFSFLLVGNLRHHGSFSVSSPLLSGRTNLALLYIYVAI